MNVKRFVVVEQLPKIYAIRRLLMEKKRNLVADYLISIFVMVGYNLPTVLVALLLKLIGINIEDMQGRGVELTITTAILYTLFVAVVVGFIFLVQKLVVKKPIANLGFRGEFLRNFLFGHLLGIIVRMIALLTTLWIFGGDFQIIRTVPKTASVTAVLWAVVWYLYALFTNSLKEELTNRSFPLEIFTKGDVHTYIIVMISSILFSAGHFLGEPFSWPDLSTMVVFSILVSIVYIHSRSIWGVIGIHSGYNIVRQLVTGNLDAGGFFRIPQWFGEGGKLINEQLDLNFLTVDTIVGILGIVLVLVLIKTGTFRLFFPKKEGIE